MATGTGEFYHNAIAQAFAGNIKTSDTLKMILLGSGYTPNLDSNVHYSDISANELSTGSGYTAGGASLSSVAVNVTAAASWGDAWAASTTYAVGQIVRPSSENGYLYQNLTAGESGSSAPSFSTTFGETVSDSGCLWANVGTSITVFTSSAVSWSSATLTAYYAAIYDSQSGSSSTDPLIALVTFSGAVTSTGGTYAVDPDSNLGWAYLTLP